MLAMRQIDEAAVSNCNGLLFESLKKDTVKTNRSMSKTFCPFELQLFYHCLRWFTSLRSQLFARKSHSLYHSRNSRQRTAPSYIKFYEKFLFIKCIYWQAYQLFYQFLFF